MKRSTLIVLTCAGLIVLCFMVYMSLQIAPNFSLCIMTIVLMVLLYVLTEQWITHAANEFENRFWTFISCALSFVCMFVDDSPLRLSHNAPVLSWLIVIVFTFLAHNYDRHIRRGRLKRVTTLKRVSSSDIMMESRDKLHTTLKRLNELLDGIDNVWLSSTFLNIFMLPRVLYIESQIIAIFTEIDHHELNYVVSNAHLGLLFYKVKDHKIAQKFNRTKILETLAIQRLSELTTLSRALLIDGLQRMKLSAHPKSDIYVRNIILKTFGDDLSDLKSITDSKGDFNSLHKLIYCDIRDDQVKKAILDHIAHQARVQKAHMKIKTSNTSKRRGQYAWRKILSDVDDTLSCSGGSYPAGIDTSYPRKVLYPGVLAFYRELDMGATGPDMWSQDRVGNLVFLSARPHVYQDTSEKHSYDMFKMLQDTRGMHTSPSLLAGSLETGGKFIVAGEMEPLAQKKYENFREYASLYTEFEFVLIGDNGQGDVRAAELISTDNEFSGNMLRAYVHEVQPLHLTHAKNPCTLTRKCPYVYYFVTYVDAAIDAYQHKLIRLSGLQRVAQEAVLDFERIPWDLFGRSYKHNSSIRSDTSVGTQKNKNASARPGPERKAPTSISVALKESFRKRSTRLLELNSALTRANEILSKGGLKPVKLLKFQCLYRRGTAVDTKFGFGVVERFRPHDGTYEVLLQMGIRSDCTGGFKAYLRGDAISKTSVTPKRRGSLIRSFFRRSVTPSEHSAPSPSPVIQHSLSTQSILSESSDLLTQKQWIAWTPYGLAKQIAERPSDDIAILTFPWGAVLYTPTNKIVKLKEVPLVQAARNSPESCSDTVPNTPARPRALSFTSPFRILSTDHTQRSASNDTPPKFPATPGFWMRLFGYGQGPPSRIPSAPGTVDIDKSEVELPPSLSENMRAIESFLADVENILTTNNASNDESAILDLNETRVVENEDNVLDTSSQEYDMFEGSLQHIEVDTAYGHGRVLCLIDRGSAVFVKVRLFWNGVGYLSLKTLNGHTVCGTTPPSTSESVLRDPHRVNRTARCLRIIRRLNQALSSGSTACETDHLELPLSTPGNDSDAIHTGTSAFHSVQDNGFSPPPSFHIESMTNDLKS